MGGPTSLDSIRPFLENLFLDPEIISFGPMEFARKPLARFISSRRAKKVEVRYEMIGGKSPIHKLSEQQAAALEKKLVDHFGPSAEIHVTPGFSYWHPFIEEAMEKMKQRGIRDVFLMPLYPQYSKSTTGSCFKMWRDLHRARGGRLFHVTSVKSWHLDSDYIAALNQRIDEGLAAFSVDTRGKVMLLFSAHGTPVSLVEQGDPYSVQIRQTVEAVMRQRNDGLDHRLSFQSKVGPANWLKPDTMDMTGKLAAAGVRHLLVIPVAFVSDHIETLHELNIELREVAQRAGIKDFHVMPALNDSKLFISSLANQIIEHKEIKTTTAKAKEARSTVERLITYAKKEI